MANVASATIASGRKPVEMEDIDDQVPPQIGDLMFDCWKFVPNHRPGLQEIRDRLAKL
jgi:hypothetical protein